MTEIKLFVDANNDIKDKILICQSNANKLGVKNGDSIEVLNIDNNLKKTAKVEISDTILDFAGQFAKNILDDLQFSGVELSVRPSSAAAKLTPTLRVPKVPTPQPTPPSEPIPEPTPGPTLSPLPTPPAPQPTPTPTPALQPTYTPTPPPQPSLTPPPTPIPQPTPAPTPTQPLLSPLPSKPPPPMEIPQPSYGQPIIEPTAPVEPFPNKIDINMLQSQINGIILTPKLDNNIEGGRVQLSVGILQQLGLGQGMLIAWEDPLTRAMGSARIDQANIGMNEIKMSMDTYEDTNIQAEQVVVYSTEPPIQQASELMLEVQSQPNLMGYALVSPRTQYTLSIQSDDILAFEDDLTGAVGAGKVEVSETTPDNVIIIDSEILEASGIGSFEVKVFKNQRSIIPLQSISLGISPISGENMWEIISTARENIDSMKGWISNYIIFKGIKLRWSAVNIACSIIDTVPDLVGDIFARVTPNTTLSLSPIGLIPFNAILIVDISRSMMARDVLVTNIAPAIEGIKAAMESREIQEFLKHFKDGINIPRRISAAFAAVLFLSEKVGRGFGEKVSVIRFADEAQILPFGGSFYMDSASGKKGVLEDAARMIVDRIGNSYGQATNMHLATDSAYEILQEFDKITPDQPTMIVLLTDGEPTMKEAFLQSVKRFSDNPNVVMYIVGLGNPNRELMSRAAALCGGEYFEPEDAGELLIWYSKRARDLTVKLKAHKV
ncbi:MAG: VWA domain-containing protein [Promethearchaeota archaeon]|nr:MAG: VWA domain-containing protein [Candidatus Lokiarchaeota archaeon]